MEENGRNTMAPGDKVCLTLKEAAAYYGMELEELSQLTIGRNCPFVIWNGYQRLIKRKKFEEFLRQREEAEEMKEDTGGMRWQ